MFTLTNLNRRNEITPLKAAGISVYRTMLPIFLLAGGVTVFSFYLKEDVIPRFKEPIRSALALARSGPLSPPPYYDKDTGFLIRVREYATTRRVGKGVEISKLHTNGRIELQMDADRIEWFPSLGGDPDEGRWLLLDGSIQRWDESGNLIVNVAASRFERLKEPFRERQLDTSLKPIDLEASDIEISYLSWKDLRNQYQRQPYHRHLAVKLHHHFALPLAHIILLFLGLPFVLGLSAKNGFLSLAASFCICALFYFVGTVCMNVANQSEFLSPILAAWLPVMLFGALGITMFDRLPT
jgi:lipopolysaccharide export LptBFGC system permease protein LptF